MELLFHDNFGTRDSFRRGKMGDRNLRVNGCIELGLRVK